jgi:tubulin beta
MGGANNDWAKGYFTPDDKIVQPVIDAVHKEVERCDTLQGFQLTHSLEGGTGGGIGSKLMSMIKDDYEKQIISTYSVLHSSVLTDSQACNTTLSISNLINFADHTFLFDNKALHDICRNTMERMAPTCDDLNQLVSLTMSGITTYLRFPNQQDYNIRGFTHHMVPYKHVHFLIPTFAPLTSSGSQQDEDFGVRRLIRQVFDVRNMMVDCSPTPGSYLTDTCLIFRGDINRKQVEGILTNPGKSLPVLIPAHVQTYFFDIPPRGMNMSVASVSNSTAMKEPLQHILNKFTNMRQHTTFCDRYISQKMDESDFEKAEQNLSELLSKYENPEGN